MCKCGVTSKARQTHAQRPPRQTTSAELAKGRTRLHAFASGGRSAFVNSIAVLFLYFFFSFVLPERRNARECFRHESPAPTPPLLARFGNLQHAHSAGEQREADGDDAGERGKREREEERERRPHKGSVARGISQVRSHQGEEGEGERGRFLRPCTTRPDAKTPNRQPRDEPSTTPLPPPPPPPSSSPPPSRLQRPTVATPPLHHPLLPLRPSPFLFHTPEGTLELDLEGPATLAWQSTPPQDPP